MQQEIEQVPAGIPRRHRGRRLQLLHQRRHPFLYLRFPQLRQQTVCQRLQNQPRLTLPYLLSGLGFEEGETIEERQGDKVTR